MNVEVGDIIRVTDTVLNLDQQTFRVVALALQTDSTVRIEAVEHDASIYPHVATEQKEIAPTLFLPNTYFNQVRTKPQNAAPENYNNGTNPPPPQTYQSLSLADKFADQPLPNNFSFVDEDVAVYENNDTSRRYYLNGAVHLATNFGFQNFTENVTGQTVQAMQARIFAAVPKGFGFLSQVKIQYFDGTKGVHESFQNLVNLRPHFFPIRPPRVIVPKIGFPTNVDYNSLRLFFHPKYKYRIFIKGVFNQTASAFVNFGGRIPNFSGHTYNLAGTNTFDASIEGLVNSVNDNFNSVVTLFPNGSNFTRNSGGSVNLGGTP